VRPWPDEEKRPNQSPEPSRGLSRRLLTHPSRHSTARLTVKRSAQ
jgi:hypothetical protein